MICSLVLWPLIWVLVKLIEPVLLVNRISCAIKAVTLLTITPAVLVRNRVVAHIACQFQKTVALNQLRVQCPFAVVLVAVLHQCLWLLSLSLGYSRELCCLEFVNKLLGCLEMSFLVAVWHVLVVGNVVVCNIHAT